MFFFGVLPVVGCFYAGLLAGLFSCVCLIVDVWVILLFDLLLVGL